MTYGAIMQVTAHKYTYVHTTQQLHSCMKEPDHSKVRPSVLQVETPTRIVYCSSLLPVHIIGQWVSHTHGQLTTIIITAALITCQTLNRPGQWQHQEN
jgi:hypothetical protein